MADDIYDDLFESLSYRLIRLGRRLDLLESRIAHEEGISLIALKLLFLINRLGPSSLASAIRETSLDQGQSSRAVRKLQDLGLLKGVQLKDRRQKLLQLSPKGKELLTRALPARMDIERALTKSVDAPHLAELKSQLEEMMEDLSDGYLAANI